MSIQSTLSELRQSQSTVEMTVGDGMAQGTEASFISSAIGRLLLNFNTTSSSGYITIGNAQRVGFEGGNTGDVTLDFQGYSPLLEGLLNTGNAAGNLTLTNYNALGTLAAAQAFGAGFTLLNCPYLATADFRGGSFGVNAAGNVSFENCAQLTAIYLPAIAGEAGFSNLPSLGSIYFGGSVATQISLTDGLSPNLASVAFATPFYGTAISLQGCALTQASVDGILAACVAGGQSNGSLDVSGGTSSPPTYDTGAQDALLTLQIASGASWLAGQSYYFTLWDGQTFWIYFDTTGSGDVTVAPDLPNLHQIPIPTVTPGYSDLYAAIQTALTAAGYSVDAESDPYLTVRASLPGVQPQAPTVNDTSGTMTQVSASAGDGNNASTNVIALQALGWTVATN